jgi:hypothetical protein
MTAEFGATDAQSPSCHSAPVLPDGANDYFSFPEFEKINDFRLMSTVHGVVFAFFVGEGC